MTTQTVKHDPFAVLRATVRWLRAPLGAFLLGISVLLLTPAAPARAHADLLASTPADGASLQVAPGELLLEFNEPVEILSGSRLSGTTASGSLEVELTLPDEKVSVASLRPSSEIPAGDWILSWRAISADGHPVGGSVRFRVGEADAGAGFVYDAPLPEAAATSSGVLVDRTLEGLTWFALATSAALAFVSRRRSSGLWALIALGTVSLRLLDFLEVYRLDMFRLGEVRSAVLVLLAAGLLAVVRSPRAVVPAAVVFALSGSQSGHPLRLDPYPLFLSAHVVHLVAAFLWSVAVLATLLDPSRVRAASRLATVAVLALLPAGALTAFGLLRGGSSDAEWDRLLLGKILLVIIALGLGAASHFLLQRSSRGLRLRSSAEIILIALVAVLSAVLTSQTPGRFAAEGSSPALEIPGSSSLPPLPSTPVPTPAPDAPRESTAEVRFEDGSTGELHVSSPRGILPGETLSAHLSVSDPDGEPVTFEQAEFEVLDAEGAVLLNGSFSAGVLAAAEMVIPAAGDWTLRVMVTFGFSTLTGETVLQVTAR